MKSKKLLTAIMIAVFAVTCLPVTGVIEAAGSSVPSVSISAPSVATVQQGGSVSFRVSTSNASSFDLKTTDVGIAGNGVSLTKTVTGSGSTRIVTLSNITGPENKLVSIAIRSGVAKNENGASTQTPKSIAFKIVGAQQGGNTGSNNNNNSGNNGGSTTGPLSPNRPGSNTGNTGNTGKDTTRPSISISLPNQTKINNGQTVTYKVTYADNVGLQKIDLKASDIKTIGFTADVSIANGSGNTRLVILRNIQGAIGGNKAIEVAAGTAWDAAGNKALGIPSSEPFEIVDTPVDPTDDTRPSISISLPDPDTIYTGETVKYIVTYKDNVGIAGIDLKPSDITLYGFTADINISGEGDQRTITLSNIQGEIGGMKFIGIAAGTAWDEAGNKTLGIPASEPFRIIERPKEEPEKPAVEVPNKKPIDWVQNPNTGIYC